MQRADLCRVFFFNDTATTEIYTLSLHDALPILVPFVVGLGAPLPRHRFCVRLAPALRTKYGREQGGAKSCHERSEEHTSELQSRQYLVCRLLLEKKKIQKRDPPPHRKHDRAHT